MLFDAGDAGKLRSFIEQLTDPTEREVAGRQISQIVDFAETAECRRVALLRYFGEEYSDDAGKPLTSCGACDNCLTPRERVNATEIAQKLISCVLRIKNHSGFAVGVVHLADVLTGAATEKIRQWKHDRLSTYGIGKNLSKKAWIYYTKELVSSGLLRINTERFNTVEVTPLGLATLKEREGIVLRAPLVTSGLSESKRSEQRKRLGGVEYDRDIFEQLRQWRAALAQKRGLPAYMILNDSTLQAISVHKPTSMAELSTISGFGEKKLAQYGEMLIEIVREHVA
jgi:ATP-dependent DNA helicase RecQ